MNDLLEGMIAYAREHSCSDIHLNVGGPAMIRANGVLREYPAFIKDTQTTEMILSMVDERLMEDFKQGKDLDFTYVSKGENRQRVNVYRQQDKLCAAIRIINNTILTLDELLMPDILKQLAMEPRGLVLVTGPTGSGKSTTLAAVMDYINERRNCHILTIEDPVEYVYQRKQALIHQREIGRDVDSFDTALRSAMREDPDVILVGEMRDYETIAAVVTLAETGHLVMSTLHTTGAAQTIDKIIDACPGESQSQIRTQLAGVLAGVVTQCLIPTLSGMERIAATEVLIGTDAALNLIRENKCHQLNTIMQSGMAHGMHTLNRDLSRLVAEGTISRESAKKYTNDIQDLEQYL